MDWARRRGPGSVSWACPQYRGFVQDKPTAKQLLEAVADFLEQDVMPELSGRKGFHVRVSVNLLRILTREWELDAVHRDADAAGIAALLGHDGDLEEMRDELAEKLRGGDFDDQADDVLAFLRAAAQRKLAIANPKYVLE